MALFGQSSNPVLKRAYQSAMDAQHSERMTLAGTINKTLLLTVIALSTAIMTWVALAGNPIESGYSLAAGAGIFAFIAVIVSGFKPQWSAPLGLFYAAVKGVFLGAISLYMEDMVAEGIVMQALVATFGVFFLMLSLYRSGTIRATPKFRKIVITAFFGIFFTYLVSWIMSMFGGGMPYIHEAGIIGVGFSVVVVVIAALMLILDFDRIEQGVQMGAPKYMEWASALGLLVTIAWMYLEILRLFAKLNGDD